VQTFHGAELFAALDEEGLAVEVEELEGLVHVFLRVAAGDVDAQALLALLHAGVGDGDHHHAVLEERRA
jgi:chemotaxis protein CheY-P-specific phosphatase CheC